MYGCRSRSTRLKRHNKNSRLANRNTFTRESLGRRAIENLPQIGSKEKIKCNKAPSWLTTSQRQPPRRVYAVSLLFSQQKMNLNLSPRRSRSNSDGMKKWILVFCRPRQLASSARGTNRLTTNGSKTNAYWLVPSLLASSFFVKIEKTAIAINFHQNSKNSLAIVGRFSRSELLAEPSRAESKPSKRNKSRLEFQTKRARRLETSPRWKWLVSGQI